MNKIQGQRDGLVCSRQLWAPMNLKAHFMVLKPRLKYFAFPSKASIRVQI